MEISSKDVDILKEPNDFFLFLVDQIQSAKTEICLASLYIGTTEKEREILSLLNVALKNNPNLKLKILLDQLRGSRLSNHHSSLTILSPLLLRFPTQVSLSFYHTPKLSGFLKSVFPQRFNEAFGLMHIKSYIFDDKVLITGANLSSDYFTNRQDRYIVFNDKRLSNFYKDLTNTISRLSHSLKHSPTNNANKKFIHQSFFFEDPISIDAKTEFSQFKERWNNTIPSESDTKSLISGDIFDDSNSDTIILSTLQMGVYSVRQEEKFLSTLISSLMNNISFLQQKSLLNKKNNTNLFSIYLSSAYINFPYSMTRALFSGHNNSGNLLLPKINVLTSSPEANGFFGSKGVSRHLPFAYTYLTTLFIKMAQRPGSKVDLSVSEYHRKQWTFHAKGVWINPTNHLLPTITSIGSSNFGERSFERDLESQVYIITKNEMLKKKIEQNLIFLYKDSKKVSITDFQCEKRRVGGGVKLAARILRGFL